MNRRDICKLAGKVGLVALAAPVEEMQRIDRVTVETDPATGTDELGGA